MSLKETKWWKALFGEKLTPQQMIRKNQRLISKAIRNVDRERYNLDRHEQKQILEIKKTAQKNQPVLVRALANDLVRLRNHMSKILRMRQQLQGISIQLQTLETQQSISQAVYQATLVLRGMNKNLNMPHMREILKEFEKQSQVAEIKGEMIGEVMDDVAGFEDDSEESEEIISQVLDELGIQIGQSLPEAPNGMKPGSSKGKSTDKKETVQISVNGANASVPDTTTDADEELLARLEKLRKS